MFLSISRPRRAFMNVATAWAGDVSGAIDRIAHFCWLGRYHVDEPSVSDDDAELPANGSPNLDRTISWADGKDTTLFWWLPTPGR